MSLAFVAKVSCHEAATPSRDAGPLPFNIGDGMHRRVVNDFESPAANKANRGFGKGFFFGVKMCEIFAFWACFISMFVNHTLLFKFFNQMIFI